jgi:flagellar biosynthesis/type III secretory pathway M-ring protein FliF/YscJ
VLSEGPYGPSQPNAAQVWFKNLSHQARITLGVAVTLVVVVIIALSVSSTGSSFPASNDQIVTMVNGSTTGSGLTVTSVAVRDTPYIFQGFEMAASTSP